MKITDPKTARRRVARMLLRWQERAREAEGVAASMAAAAARDLAVAARYVDAVAPAAPEDLPEDEREAVDLYRAGGAAVDGRNVPAPPHAGRAYESRCRAVTGYGERCRSPVEPDSIFCGLHAGRIQ